MRALVVVGAVTLLALAALPAAGAGERPSLRVVGERVRGEHFAPRESVRLTFAGPAPRVQRRVRASAAGSFATALPAHDPCLGAVEITARGATGDEARLKLPQRACPPQP